MPMPFKLWKKYPPDTTTPINAVALMALEQRVGNYTGAVGVTGPGVDAYESFRVKQHGGGDMTVDVGLPNVLMAGAIALDLLGSIERYEYNSGQINVPIGVADPANPRIDRVVLVPAVVDTQAPTVAIIPGTPFGGTTLDSLLGAAAVPTGRLLLADVLVPAAAVTVVTANIRDRRAISNSSTLPFFASVGGSNIDAVVPQFMPGLVPGTYTLGTAASTFQSAAAFWLPRRIVNATRIRWKYNQNPTTALTGTYVLAIYDASGRKIIDTGAPIATGGVAGSLNPRAEIIAATTFEVGLYYLLQGWTVASGNLAFGGVSIANTGAIVSAGLPNLAIAFASGSAVAPQTLLAGSDSGGAVSNILQIGVPQIALSVG